MEIDDSSIEIIPPQYLVERGEGKGGAAVSPYVQSQRNGSGGVPFPSIYLFIYLSLNLYSPPCLSFKHFDFLARNFTQYMVQLYLQYSQYL
jgi:hypothetical protein